MEGKSNKQANKRTLEEKVLVVRVKSGRVKGEDHQHNREKVEGDFWRWRKCGQKTIKSSPVIRNYYRCTTKGCTAKKQVEESQQDGSTLIITYISSHNHADLGPPRKEPSPTKRRPKAQTTKEPINKGGSDDHIHILDNQEEKPYVVKLDTITLHQPPSCNSFLQEHNTFDLNDIAAIDCDFFEELNEELQVPTSSSLFT